MYNKAYGNTHPEPVSELVPYILDGFLDNDKDFVRAEKKMRHENQPPEVTGHSKLGVRA